MEQPRWTPGYLNTTLLDPDAFISTPIDRQKHVMAPQPHRRITTIYPTPQQQLLIRYPTLRVLDQYITYTIARYML